MKSLLFLSVFVLMTSVYADDQQARHIISIGSDGFGFSGVGESFNWAKNEKSNDDIEESEGRLELNYMYVFPKRWMIGGEISYGSETIIVKEANANVTKAEETSHAIGVSLGYNFSEHLTESWWVKGTLSNVYQENKLKRTGVTTEKGDTRGNELKLSLGKRFNLTNYNLANLAFSPSVEVNYISYSGKEEDLGLDSTTDVVINLLKFDLLF